MKKKSNRMTKALLEMVKDMRDAEILDEEAYEKITVRHLDEKRPIDPISSRGNHPIKSS